MWRAGALPRHQGLIHPVGGTEQAWQREGSWCSRCGPLGQVLPKRKPIGVKRQRKKDARKQGKEKRGGMEEGACIAGEPAAMEPGGGAPRDPKRCRTQL